MGCVCVENKSIKLNQELRYFWSSLKISKLSSVDIYSIFSHKKRPNQEIPLSKWETIIKNLFSSEDPQYKKFSLDFFYKQISLFKQLNLEEHFILSLLLIAKSSQHTITSDVIKMCKLCSIEIKEETYLTIKDLKGILTCLFTCCANQELLNFVCNVPHNNKEVNDNTNTQIECFINKLLNISTINNNESKLNEYVNINEFLLNNYSLLHNIGEIRQHIIIEKDTKR